MSLVPVREFEPLLAPLAGKRIGLAVLNPDLASHVALAGLAGLFRAYGVGSRRLSRREVESGRFTEPCDEILLTGGLRLSNDDERMRDARVKLTGLGLPVRLYGPIGMAPGIEPIDFAAVYVEGGQFPVRPPFVVCPFAGLGLEPFPHSGEPDYAEGVFLDGVAADLEPPLSHGLGRPDDLCDSLEDCMELCGRFQRIVTDHPGLAAAALAIGRRVVLVPGPRSDNRSFAAAARDLVEWRSRTTDGAKTVAAVRTVCETLYPRLCAAPADSFPFSARPRRRDGFELREIGQEIQLVAPGGDLVVRCNPVAMLIWRASTGEHSIEDMVEDFAAHYRQPRMVIARDVHDAIRDFVRAGALALDLVQRIIEAGNDGAVTPGGRRPLPRGGRGRTMMLQVRPPFTNAGTVMRTARLSEPDSGGRELWFETARELRGALTPRADPFVLASLFRAMVTGSALWVRGAAVTESLLYNLDEYQRAWLAWMPRLHYAPVLADEIRDDRFRDAASVLAFSGGVDSCYSVHRHAVEPDGFRKPQLVAALLVHGYDVPHHEIDAFECVHRRASAVLEDAGIELLTLRTNVKSNSVNWDYSHGLGLAAALSFFGERFGSGLIAATMPYQMLQFGGSNPVTDPLMGSRYFGISNDGSAMDRLDKVRAIVRWPAALENVRFCWRDPEYGNCGRCAKCLLTAMMFQVLESEHVPCFGAPLTAETVASRLGRVRFGTLERHDAHMVCREADARSLRPAWLPVVRKMIGPETPGTPKS